MALVFGRGGRESRSHHGGRALAAQLTARAQLDAPSRSLRPRGLVAISIDDGPEPATTPRVLEILDEQRAKATFFCIGERMLRHRALAREIVDRGHAIENHSFRHPSYFSLLGASDAGLTQKGAPKTAPQVQRQ